MTLPSRALASALWLQSPHLQRRRTLATPGQGYRGWVAMGGLSPEAGRLREKWGDWSPLRGSLTSKVPAGVPQAGPRAHQARLGFLWAEASQSSSPSQHQQEVDLTQSASSASCGVWGPKSPLHECGLQPGPHGLQAQRGTERPQLLRKRTSTVPKIQPLAAGTHYLSP